MLTQYVVSSHCSKKSSLSRLAMESVSPNRFFSTSVPGAPRLSSGHKLSVSQSPTKQECYFNYTFTGKFACFCDKLYRLVLIVLYSNSEKALKSFISTRGKATFFNSSSMDSDIEPFTTTAFAF
jgi:hypothetical protein